MANFKKIGFITLLFTIISLTAYSATIQSIPVRDLSNVKVETLTDEEILQYIRRAERSGYSAATLETLARQQGMPETEIQLLKRRVEQLQSGQGGFNSSPLNPSLSRVSPVAQPIVDSPPPPPVETSTNDDDDRIFGISLFRNQNLTFAPTQNIPTPKEYTLGPGDELVIDFWGSAELSTSLVITPEGTVRPSNLGPIYLNGLSIQEAEKKLIDRLSRVYAGLKPSGGNPPTIFYQISLGNIKSINVTLVGEVNVPGNYTMNSLSTVYTALHAAGGPTAQGTFRSIRLMRNNQLLEEVDLYKFLVDGLKQGDRRLMNGDVIVVKPYQSRVETKGQFKRVGFFELLPDESFNDLLNYSGGFTTQADRSIITVKRNSARGGEILDLYENDFGGFGIMDGDVFQIGAAIQKFTNRVQIEGAVHRPGEYQLTNGLTMRQLIEKSNGLRGDAYTTRASIYRLQDDLTQNVISVDLAKLLSGAIADVPLEAEDVVKVNSIHDLKEEYAVQIFGEVQDPGSYPFLNGISIQELIVLAGGLTEGASGALIEISRRNNNNDTNISSEIISASINRDLSLSDQSTELLLKPFDQVYIRRRPGYMEQEQVTIEGEVTAPGVYAMNKKDERVSDLVTRARGLTPYAYPKGAILIRRTEFSSGQNSSQIPVRYLRSLRDKLMEGRSGSKNVTEERLSDRLDRLEAVASIEAETDELGSEIKSDLIEQTTSQDSLITNYVPRTQEPVALDLVEILKNPGSEYDYILRPGDVVSIPPQLETVRVTGEVASTINLRYVKSNRFKDYIFSSGGYLRSASRGRSYVQYPNGERKGVRRFLFFKKYPKVEPGSTIFVSRKPVRTPFRVESAFGIVGSTVTLILLIERLNN